MDGLDFSSGDGAFKPDTAEFHKINNAHRFGHEHILFIDVRGYIDRRNNQRDSF